MNSDVTFDPAAYELAHARMTSSPIDLTEADFDQLKIVSPGLETGARAMRRQAQLAVHQHQPAPLATKSAPAPAAPARKKKAPPDSMEEWVQQNGKKVVTGAILAETTDVLIDVLAAQKKRMDTLEQANKDLQSRILELEAQAAARTVEHVDR